MVCVGIGQGLVWGLDKAWRVAGQPPEETWGSGHEAQSCTDLWQGRARLRQEGADHGPLPWPRPPSGLGESV